MSVPESMKTKAEEALTSDARAAGEDSGSVPRTRMPGRLAREGEPLRFDMEKLLLLGVFLLGLLPFWWAAQPAFVLPNNDYYSFERAAQSLAAFELPQSLKRGPTDMST